MIFNVEMFVPAFFGFASGMLAPILVEKWKGRRKDMVRIISLENEINLLKSSVKHFTTIEERVRSLEISYAESDALKEQVRELGSLVDRVRSVEMNMVHNSAVLKMQMNDPKDTTNNSAPEVLKAG